MPKPDWRKKTAWRLDEAEKLLDTVHGSTRERVCASERLEAEPPAASSASSDKSYDFPCFPWGLPDNEEQELQAMRVGTRTPRTSTRRDTSIS